MAKSTLERLWKWERNPQANGITSQFNGHMLCETLGKRSTVQLSEEIRSRKELIKAAVHPFNHFVIHRFKSHLWAVIAGISCHNTSVTGNCLPQLDQLMLDSALSLAGEPQINISLGLWLCRGFQAYQVICYSLLHTDYSLTGRARIQELLLWWTEQWSKVFRKKKKVDIPI